MSPFRGKRQFLMGLLVLAGIVAPSGAAFASQSCLQRDTPNLILPGNPEWAADLNVYPDQVNAGTVLIDGANPRSGLGSLSLTTSGSLFDWAFFQRTAGGEAAWGLLSAVNCLTFDWFRQAYDLPPDADAALTAETWQEQTPVLRLMVRDFVGDQVINSQLVWERWYNTKGVLDPTANGIWHFEDLTSQQFWRHFDGGLTYTNLGCANGSFENSSQLQTFDLPGWVTNCYSSTAQIYGIMVGVGSWWPGAYGGNVDNVQLRFAGDEGFAVEDNFELGGPTTTTPEPGTMALMASGLAAMMSLTLLKRRRRKRSEIAK